MTKTTAAPKPKAPSVTDLETALTETRERIRNLNEQLDKSMGFDLSVTTEIQGLRDFERRISERLEEAKAAEAEREAARNRKRFIAEYETTVQAVATQQRVVERLVNEVLVAADELRQLDAGLREAARRVEKAGGEVTTRPPLALWQRHAGGSVPYCDTVQRALRNL